MLVGNHSGGHRHRRRDGHRVLPPRDGPAAPRAGDGREVHQPLPVRRTNGRAAPASSRACRSTPSACSEDDRLLLVFPEGARGTAKLFRERNSLVDFGVGLRPPGAQDADAHRPLRRARRGRGVSHGRQRVQARTGLRACPTCRSSPTGCPVALPAKIEIEYGAAAAFRGHRQRGRRGRRRLRRQGQGSHPRDARRGRPPPARRARTLSTVARVP